MLAAGIPKRAAISPMGLRVAFCAISMSELTISPVLSRPMAALMEVGPTKTGRCISRRKNIAKCARPKRMRAAGSHGQHDFPNVIRRLHEAVRFAGLGQR